MQGLPNHALSSVKVLDFGWALVGSLAAKMLADFGAEVIKVESALRPCLTRIDKQVSVSERGNFNDKPWFSHFNTSKLSLQINMKHPRVREIIDPLIDWADVIMENFSPGTMAGLGLDYESIQQKRPDIIMVSGSVFGQSGPYAKNWGVDGTGAALAGRMYLSGWPDRDPVAPSVPYGDLVLPYVIAATVSAALEHKRQTGVGQHIDASMYEVCAQQMSESLLNTQLQNNVEQQRQGNQLTTAFYQGIYPCQPENGEDKWIAISFYSAEQWQAFTNLISNNELPTADKISLLTPNQLPSLEEKISQWTRPQDRYELMTLLQQHGIAAGVVQDIADTYDHDPQLKHREYLCELEHPIIGKFGHQAPPVKLSRTPAQVKLAPALGEHTEDICKRIIGLSDEQIQSLIEDKLFQ